MALPILIFPTMALVLVQPITSMQAYLAPLLHTDRVIQDLYEVMFELQELDDILTTMNLPGITPPMLVIMLGLAAPVRRIIAAAMVHRLRTIVQLQRNLHLYWRQNWSPPALDFQQPLWPCYCLCEPVFQKNNTLGVHVRVLIHCDVPNPTVRSLWDEFPLCENSSVLACHVACLSCRCPDNNIQQPIIFSIHFDLGGLFRELCCSRINLSRGTQINEVWVRVGGTQINQQRW